MSLWKVLFVSSIAMTSALRHPVSFMSMQLTAPKPPTKVAVVGATGRTGQRIVQQLSSSSSSGGPTTIKCVVREASRAKAEGLFGALPNVQIEAVGGDLTAATPQALATLLAGCDTVVCALGALENEVLNVKAPYLIDGKLSQTVVEAAKLTGTVRHFVLVTSLGTDRFGLPASVLNLFWGVLSWKRQTELKLIASGLPYTIVRPGGMERPTDDYELTHNMKLHLPSTTFGGNVSRKQVAALCVASVLRPDLAGNRIMEVTADTAYPKRTATELLEQLPAVVSEDDWRARLSPDQYYILREAGTERPWTSPLNDEKRPGVFACAGCGNELFPSTTKFESGTGWPSFYAPKGSDAVAERTDMAFGMVRTETLCAKCGGHLGHVFPDGPKPTGQRYCINGAALRFVPAEELVDKSDAAAQQRAKLMGRLDG